MKTSDEKLNFMYTLPYKIFVFCFMIPCGVAIFLKGFEGIIEGFLVGGVMVLLQIPWLLGLKERYDKEHKNDNNG